MRVRKGDYQEGTDELRGAVQKMFDRIRRERQKTADR
jgi:hypothetical protein